jgi:hypothetical protein
MNWLAACLGKRGILIRECGARDAAKILAFMVAPERFTYKGTRRRKGYFPTSNLLILPMQAQLNG